MPDPHPLDYRPEPRRSLRPACVGLAVALLLIATLIYFLFELQRAPYRPPYDMSTFLGAQEIAFVRVLIGVLALVWACAVRRRCSLPFSWPGDENAVTSRWKRFSSRLRPIRD